MTKVYNKFYSSEYLRYYGFLMLTFAIILNCALYLFFINLGVSYIFSKKAVTYDLRDLRQENQILEGAYLEEFKKINPDYAFKNGFIDAKSPLFVSRVKVVAINDGKNLTQ